MSTTRTTSTPPTPDAPPRRSPAATIGAVSTAVFALTTLVAGLVTGGGANAVAAAFALLPLVATVGYLRSARWAPVTGVVMVLLVLMLRMVAVSFDLVRPGDAVPFAVAAVTVLSAGVVLTSALFVVLERRSEQPAPRRATVGVAAGVIVGAAAGLAIVLASPQLDDTGDLTSDQVAALPTVEMVNFRFEPGQLRVAEGQPVAFHFSNDTDETHSFAIETLGIDVVVPSGRSRTVVIDVGAGTYPFVCTVNSHREDGMVGQLVVEGDGHTADDGDDQGADHDH